MGYTFAAALLKKAGTVPATRKAFRQAMEHLGYRKAGAPEAAVLSLRMHQDKKSAWVSLAMEVPSDPNEESEFLRKVAAEMQTPALYFINLDSDFLYIAATDGKAVQHVHVGFLDEDDEAMTDSDDLSIFDALLPDDAARAEFRRILAVDDEERVFSEEAAQEMAALFGYTPEVLFIDEDAPVCAEFSFDLPGSDAVPFLMPEDAPPAFTKSMAVTSVANPSEIFLHSCGGAGKGVRITIQAVGYDAMEWDAPVAAICRSAAGYVKRTAEDYWRGVPERASFSDGSKGWTVELPDVPIEPGVNLKNPLALSQKAHMHYFEHSLQLWVAFTDNSEKDAPDDQLTGFTRVFISPLENPQGFVYFDVPRRQFERNKLHGAWQEGYI